MQLVNFSTGRIRTQVIDGEEIRTAYVKAPVPEPWVITATGADGDQVAVHSDHLYAFDRESYDYWAAELGADRANWPDGHFAENLTLDTLDQSALRVGDRFRVGTAELVVAGPRVPCWKLTWRLGQPKTFMRRFRVSGRSGTYFTVAEPGVVRPGDRFELLDRVDGAPTVAELAQLCDTGVQLTDEQRLQIDRALALPQLSPTVRGTLDLKLANLARDAGAAERGWPGWRRFVIHESVAETADATSYVLRPVDGLALPSYRAGQHVVVRLPLPDGGPVTRTWSLSDHSAAPEWYRITVKAQPGGVGSGALRRAAAQGLEVELRAPAGRFHLDRGSFRPVVLVAAGIGITPMIAMVQAHLDRSRTVPPLWLLYGAPDPESTAFRDHLDRVFARHRDLRLHYFWSRSTGPAGAATVHAGRITAERVVEVLRGNFLRTPDGVFDLPWFESDIYLCGSIDFTAALRAGLVEAGANPDLVFDEDFAPAAGDPTGPRRTEDASVCFATRGLEARWIGAQERTLLELAEDHGLELPNDCRVGSCRTCEAQLLDGEVDGPVTEAVDGSRRVLLCRSYPLSDHVVVRPPDS
jgi:ferredoxin-NADP reductase/MOSC domain-containing protein YiiM